MARFIGIDLGSRTIRAIVATRRGPVLELLRAVELPCASGDEGTVLAAAAGLSTLGKAAGACFSVSGKDVIIRYTQVPPVAPWRVRLLMDLEVKEMAHQAGAPLAADYNLVGSGARDSETVLVAVVREHFLQDRFAAVRAAVGEPRSALPASIALFNAWMVAGALHEGEVVMLVDIGEKNTEVVLLKDGELLFARNLYAGGGIFTDAVAAALGVDRSSAEEAKETSGNVDPRARGSWASGREERVSSSMLASAGQLASMLQSSLAFSKAQLGDPNLKPTRILLSGGGACLKGLSAYLESALATPCSRFLPESGLDTSELPQDERVAFETDPGRFVVALGLAAGRGAKNSFQVELVPQTVVKSRAFMRQGVWRWAAAAFLVCFLGWTWWDMSTQSDVLVREAAQMKTRAQNARRRDEQYRAELAQVATLNVRQKLLAGETETAFAFALGAWLVQQASPDGVWVEQIDARRGPFPKDHNDPKKGKEIKTVLTVSGEILSVDTQSERALQQIVEGIRTQRKGVTVRITKQSAGAASGSKKLGFQIEADLFPETAEDVGDTAGGN
ncbi:MAG: hypothetical protein EXS14_05505 [Planctomycetes bacterium]|nr:hypothetical protein [Planctomycetota bacterium]